MPAYNRAGFLREAIESVLASTFSDFELIIVDDASTDATAEIADQCAQLDDRIRVHVNRNNLGQFANRNHAASLAKGDFLKYLDSDDVIYPHGLEVMVRCLDSYPEAAAAISHDQLHEDLPYPLVLSPAESYRAFYLGHGFPNSGPSAAIVRKSAFDTVGGFVKPFYVGSDTVLWLRLARQFSLVKLPPALSWYRRHEGQAILQGIESLDYLRSGYTQIAQLLSDPACPLSSEERQNAHVRLSQHHARRILVIAMKQRAPRTAWKLFRESGLTTPELLSGLRRYQ